MNETIQPIQTRTQHQSKTIMKPRKTVLLVEDNEQMRKTTSTLLNLYRYNVIEAVDGSDALNRMKQINPDMVLCDIRMPGANGMEVLDAIRADPEKCSTPFVFLSGLSEKGEVRAGMNRGADDYLTKPFTTKELLTTIGSNLRKNELKHHDWEKEQDQWSREREGENPSHEVTPMKVKRECLEEMKMAFGSEEEETASHETEMPSITENQSRSLVWGLIWGAACLMGTALAAGSFHMVYLIKTHF